MTCFASDVEKIFTDWRYGDLLKDIENSHAELVKRRIAFIEYGDPSKLTPKQRTKLNSQLLRHSLLHRAECLIVATGHMLLAKNVYGLAFVARGHVEATAVLAYFCRRVDWLSKGNIDFDRFEEDVANGVMGGARHDLFSKATKIVTCVETGDKFLDEVLFDGKKTGFLKDIYGRLSEFAHPNFCSNKSAFMLDKATGRMVFRHDSDLQESDFRLIGYLSMSAKIFPRLFDEFGERADLALRE